MTKLTFNRREAQLLSHALTNTTLQQYSESQKLLLPIVTRRLAHFLADEPVKPKLPKPGKCNPFDTPERRAVNEQIRALIVPLDFPVISDAVRPVAGP